MGTWSAKPCSDCHHAVNHKVWRLKRWNRALPSVRVTSHDSLRRRQSSGYGASIWNLCGISDCEYFPHQTDIHPTGSHHRNESSRNSARVSQQHCDTDGRIPWVSSCYPRIPQDCDKEGYSWSAVLHRVSWFLAKNCAFQGGCPPAQLENLI